MGNTYPYDFSQVAMLRMPVQFGIPAPGAAPLGKTEPGGGPTVWANAGETGRIDSAKARKSLIDQPY
ncbi:MAG TPA: hypothetical protein VHW09_26775 [Bryobacteraceae bacterium]|nr:hypothetical protein [Bryobacteraceae bacterium]